MKLSNLDLKTSLLILIGIVCAVVWGVMAYQDASLRPDLLVYVKSTLIGLAGLVLRDLPNPAPAAPSATASPVAAPPTP